MKVKLKNNYAADQLITLIKDNVDIIEVALDLGVDVYPDIDSNGWSKAICPFHTDTNPSCGFNGELGCYNCFACGAAGDVIKLVQGLKETDFNSALDFLQKYLPNGNGYKVKFFDEFTVFKDKTDKTYHSLLKLFTERHAAPIPGLQELFDDLQIFWEKGCLKFEEKLDELCKVHSCKRKALLHQLIEDEDTQLMLGLYKFKNKVELKFNGVRSYRQWLVSN